LRHLDGRELLDAELEPGGGDHARLLELVALLDLVKCVLGPCSPYTNYADCVAMPMRGSAREEGGKSVALRSVPAAVALVAKSGS
jgi:hypothetical protein